MAPPMRRPSTSSSDSDGSMEDVSTGDDHHAISWAPAPPPPPIIPRWSRTLKVVRDRSLNGDRMKMSPTVLEEILNLAGSSPLPSPLVFEVVAAQSRLKVVGSVREFTVEEDDTISVGDTLANSLLGAESMDVDEVEDVPTATVKLVSLPKCEYLKLAPLEDTYLLIPDVRATLEAHLRQNYATIAEGETLTVLHRTSNSSVPQENHFLITEVLPAKACTCIDVDINLDIVPLDSGLAENAVLKKHKGPADSVDSSALIQLDNRSDGKLSLERTGIVVVNETIVYKLRFTEAARNLKVTVEPQSGGDADLFVSLTNETPSLRDHHYMDVSSGVSTIHFVIMDDPSETPFIYFAVKGCMPSTSFKFRVETCAETPQEKQEGPSTPITEPPAPNTKQCDNCYTWILEQIMLFANSAATLAGRMFLKKTRLKTIGIVPNAGSAIAVLNLPQNLSPSTVAPNAPNVSSSVVSVASASALAHPLVPPKTFFWAAIFLNTNPNVEFHDVQRRNQPNPRICPNSQCSAIPSDQFSNVLALCKSCFSPFWSARHDPGNQKLATKLLGAYHAQLTAGCGKAHCKNKYCATSSNTDLLSAPMDANEAAVHALTLLKQSVLFKPKVMQYHLCVADAVNANRRAQAENMVGMGYHVSWCVKALLEYGDNAGKATDWLMANAPRVDKT
ncbi:ubiquitin fusion degradation protein UFD1-domain-containing protein [Chytridium lagenaria]|nr:ubiquitin fusion degradation protein UFD1-domain-containing protein [Chytridium lagenaria]